jgi:ribosomal RNA assembly protein
LCPINFKKGLTFLRSMPEFSYQIKIPKDRIAVLIGKKGETKKLVEETTKTNIRIDSTEGDVSVAGEDAIRLYAARDVIRAIARGFNPDVALILLKQDYSLEILNLKDYVKPTQVMRIKGRVIGEAGKSRENIERLTECSISVYGKTISVIGRVESVLTARRAIESLIKGSPHANVYKWLEKMRREQKRRQFEDDIGLHLRKPEMKKDLEKLESGAPMDDDKEKK